VVGVDSVSGFGEVVDIVESFVLAPQPTLTLLPLTRRLCNSSDVFLVQHKSRLWWRRIALTKSLSSAFDITRKCIWEWIISYFMRLVPELERFHRRKKRGKSFSQHWNAQTTYYRYWNVVVHGRFLFYFK
jgi:hypothetical protein